VITTEPLVVRKLRGADLARLATVGLRTRKLRAGLSALGIAIGVAAIVAVLGLSSSASAGLLDEISALGTNLLVVQNGQTVSGQPAELPTAAPAMIGRIDAVTEVQETGSVTGDVFRSPLIPSIDTNALSIEAASLGLPHTVSTGVAQGSYLNAASAQEPVCVLGAAAAQRIGYEGVDEDQAVAVPAVHQLGLRIVGPHDEAALVREVDDLKVGGGGHGRLRGRGRRCHGPP